MLLRLLKRSYHNLKLFMKENIRLKIVDWKYLKKLLTALIFKNFDLKGNWNVAKTFFILCKKFIKWSVKNWKWNSIFQIFSILRNQKTHSVLNQIFDLLKASSVCDQMPTGHFNWSVKWPSSTFLYKLLLISLIIINPLIYWL